MTEAEWQRTVLEAARLFRWRVAHFRPAMTRHGWVTPVAADGRGFPDLVLVRERVLWVELKTDRGHLTADQQLWLDALTGAGQAAFVWRPGDWSEVVRALRGRDLPV